jgi:putative ABC transport system substrate-binding protein
MKVRLLRLIAALTVGLLIVPPAGGAQQSGKIPQIALLVNSPEADLTGTTPKGRNARAFLEAMRELGWVDGQTVTIERRSTDGRPDRGQRLIQELVRLRVDVIVTVGGFNVRAAKQLTTTIPIVAAGVSFPVESGFIASLARPGGNITGLSFEASGDLTGKRLELLKEVSPKTSRVAVIAATRGRGRPFFTPEAEAAARTLGMILVAAPVDAPEEYEKAFAIIGRERVHALFIGLSPVGATHRQPILDFAARKKLPTMGAGREFAASGGLMAYGPDNADLFRRAASYVDKILKGARPADLPVEQPTKFELAINLKAARALNLKIPNSLLLRADHVID